MLVVKNGELLFVPGHPCAWPLALLAPSEENIPHFGGDNVLEILKVVVDHPLLDLSYLTTNAQFWIFSSFEKLWTVYNYTAV